MPALPVEDLDVLIIDEIGKNYSGTGLDVNILGRQMVEGEPDTQVPRITRICVLDLSPESHGNAVGLGVADLTTQRLLDKIDPAITNMNYFTACFLLRAKTPLALPTDRACIEMGLKTCWQPRTEWLRMAIIPNTLEVAHLWMTKALVEEMKGRPDIAVAGDARAIPFTSHGWLEQEMLFPRSIRARRNPGASQTRPLA